MAAWIATALLGCRLSPSAAPPRDQATEPVASPVASPAVPPTASTTTDTPVPVDSSFRLAFGSCSDLRRSHDLWPTIVGTDPAVWIWMGDNIYADTEDIGHMRALYDELKQHPGYAQLRNAVQVVGTWDDHDYGVNDGGKEYPQRQASQAALLDFLDEPPNSPRRQRQGVYTSHDFGEGDRMVRVVLLDTRYHRDPPGPDGDVLGEAQWQWLQGELTQSPARAHVLVSSIQLVADDHPYEKWGHFPKARARLLALLDSAAPRNLVVLSGDRHFAELSRLTLPSGRALYDLTSSSLSRPKPEAANGVNHQRIGEAYGEANFGILEYDWDQRQARLSVRDELGAIRIAIALPLE